MRCERRGFGRHASSHCERIKHVRQKHAAPDDRFEYGSGLGGRTGQRFSTATFTVADRRVDSRDRLLARQSVALLRRNYTPPSNRRPNPQTGSVLFLLDELLSGTNSHDRRIGAAGLIKGLLRGNTIGLLTTHDLALSDIVDDLPSIAANVHFEDRITDGKMEFDYQLRPGVVTHSNALELMRAVGLDV